jgi:hypothetical protein
MERIDYLKVSVLVPNSTSEASLANLEHLREVYRQAEILCEGRGGWKEYTDYHTNPAANLHYLESWGLCSDWVARIIQNAHSHWELMRVDYRVELADNTPVKKLSEYASDKGRRGHTQYNTRPRTKAEGRERGGFGFYKGSSKSERQACIYRIEDEGTCIEVRRKDKAARTIQNDWKREVEKRWIATGEDTTLCLPEDVNTYCNYDSLIDIMLQEMEADCESEIGVTLDTLVRRDWATIGATRTAAEVFNDFTRLPRSEQLDFISKLF